TGKEERILNHDQEPVWSVAFSTQGSMLATGGDSSGWVSLWDAQTGERLRKLKDECRLVHALSFSADGKLLAASCGDTAIRVWNVESGAKLAELRQTRERYSPHAALLAFAPDGRSLASAWNGGSFSLWEIITRQERCFVRPDKKRIRALA